MSNSVQDPNAAEAAKAADTPMGAQEQVEKGKGKAAETDAMDEDDDDDDEEEEEVSLDQSPPALV
jgi:ribosomal protein L12E/L44/L45/RPP1/RPP2